MSPSAPLHLHTLVLIFSTLLYRTSRRILNNFSLRHITYPQLFVSGFSKPYKFLNSASLSFSEVWTMMRSSFETTMGSHPNCHLALPNNMLQVMFSTNLVFPLAWHLYGLTNLQAASLHFRRASWNCTDSMPQSTYLLGINQFPYPISWVYAPYIQKSMLNSIARLHSCILSICKLLG